jgi:phosphohistidine phosphatase
MRRLILLRHAKSSRPPGIDDFERPLAARGREAAGRMGTYLREQDLSPDLALVSPSRRTRETWDLVRPALGEVETRFEQAIYEAPATRLLSAVRDAGPEARSVLMIGHNPGFEDLARQLAGEGDPDELARLSEKFPTSAVVVIDFPVESWAEIEPRGGRLERFVAPKDLGVEEDD